MGVIFLVVCTGPVESVKSELTPVHLVTGFMNGTRNSDDYKLGLKNNLRFFFFFQSSSKEITLEKLFVCSF